MLVFINLMLQDINLPDVKLGEKDTSMKQLIKWDLSFDSYFKAAPYLLDDMELKGTNPIAFT